MLIFNLLQVLILIALGMATAYLLVFSVAGHFYRSPRPVSGGRYRRMAVLIPGYKEDEVIVHVASEALKQDYPSESYDVVVIADSFEPATLDRLKALPVKVIEVSFDKSTKAKALNRAMAVLENDYDIAVVLDADNIMQSNFLGKINAAFYSSENKVMAVQGHRTAKNQNTPLAILDAISEEINNHIFRKGHRALKLSSAIIGSGMAFRYGFFKELMSNVEAVGGFDKEIELKMLKEGFRIEYLDQALVYDEKIQKEEAFSNQRRRWLAAQFVYLRRDFLGAVKHLIVNRNIDYFDKVIQFVQPPRILLLGAIVLSGTIFTITNMMLENSGFERYWISLMVFCLASLFLSVPFSFYNRKTFLALVYLPKGMFLMMKSLFQIKGANKQFIHTRHTIIPQDQGIK